MQCAGRAHRRPSESAVAVICLPELRPAWPSPVKQEQADDTSENNHHPDPNRAGNFVAHDSLPLPSRGCPHPKPTLAVALRSKCLGPQGVGIRAQRNEDSAPRCGGGLSLVETHLLLRRNHRARPSRLDPQDDGVSICFTGDVLINMTSLARQLEALGPTCQLWAQSTSRRSDRNSPRKGHFPQRIGVGALRKELNAIVARFRESFGSGKPVNNRTSTPRPSGAYSYQPCRRGLRVSHNGNVCSNLPVLP